MYYRRFDTRKCNQFVLFLYANIHCGEHCFSSRCIFLLLSDLLFSVETNSTIITNIVYKFFCSMFRCATTMNQCWLVVGCRIQALETLVPVTKLNIMVKLASSTLPDQHFDHLLPNKFNNQQFFPWFFTFSHPFSVLSVDSIFFIRSGSFLLPASLSLANLGR